jgi:hypothetical protein
MKKYIVYIFIISILYPINFLFSQTTININPSTYYCSSGDTVRVIVRINNVVNLHCVSTTVRFNNSIVKFLYVSNYGGITNGNWIGNQPSNPYVTDSVIVDQALQGWGLSVSGTDTLFSIYFKAIANGNSPVSIKSLDMRDPYNNSITATLDSGHIFVGGITVNAKVFLQGTYETGTGLMNTSLNSAGCLPFSQPYNSLPWNYNGTEFVFPGFFNSRIDIVDWVLIELRTSTNSGSAFRKRAALIKNDGTIVDCIDGISPVYINDTTPGNYYLVISHRNHIAVMSAYPVDMSLNSPLFDFTTSFTNFYGGDAQLLNANIYGLYTGDIDANGEVDSIDINMVLLAIGQIGYASADVNLSGFDNAIDRNLVYLNTGKVTNVP